MTRSSRQSRSSLDTVVFDCDGVLVDTAGSYTAAQVRALEWLLGERVVDEAAVRAWRLVGHWNNDWDLVHGLYCWRAGLPDVPSAEAARLTLDELARRAAAKARWTYDETRGVFEELYSGTPAAVARWKIDARVHNDHPLSDEESVVLRAELLEELRALGVRKFGVVTGRDLHDWEHVAPRIPFGTDVVVATDEDGRKPDPAALRKVLRALDAGPFVAVGDTMSDLGMVLAHNRTGAPQGTAVILCNESEEPTYRAQGATHFIRALDELPQVIRRLGA